MLRLLAVVACTTAFVLVAQEDSEPDRLPEPMVGVVQPADIGGDPAR